MTLSQHIIVGETISHDAKKILRGIRHPFLWKRGLWYGVTTAASEENLLYILPCPEMRNSYYLKSDIRLLGLAGSMREAYDIVRKLVQEGYDSGHIHDMRRYLREY